MRLSNFSGVTEGESLCKTAVNGSLTTSLWKRRNVTPLSLHSFETLSHKLRQRAQRRRCRRRRCRYGEYGTPLGPRGFPTARLPQNTRRSTTGEKRLARRLVPNEILVRAFGGLGHLLDCGRGARGKAIGAPPAPCPSRPSLLFFPFFSFVFGKGGSWGAMSASSRAVASVRGKGTTPRVGFWPAFR